MMTTDTRIGEALRQVVRRADGVHRCFAARALGRIGHADAVDDLIGCLVDEDEDVRMEAAEALGRIGDRRAGPALLESLRGDPCGDVKVNAVVALGRLKEPAAVPALRRLVQGRDDSVAWDDQEFLDGGWDDWLDVQVTAIEALAAMGAAEAMPDIVRAMDDELGQDLGETGMRALAALGGPGAKALAAYLGASDERLRLCAVRVLSDAASAEADELLARGLEDASPEVRLAALRGLARRDGAYPRLAARLDDPDPRVRAEVVRLYRPGWPAPPGDLMDDPGEEVQAAVIERLAADPGAPPPGDLIAGLRARLGGSSAPVAAAACGAIAALAPEIAADALGGLLRDADCTTGVKRAAAGALGALATDQAVEALQAAVADDDRHVRMQAVASLAAIAAGGDGDSPARKVLLEALAGRLTPPPEAEDGPDAGQGGHAPTVDEAGPAAGDDPAGAEDEANGGGEEPHQGPWPTSTLAALTGPGPGGGKPAVLAEDVELDEADLEYLALARTLPRKKRISPDAKIPVHEDVPRIAARVLGDVAGDEVARALAAAIGCPDMEVRRVAADSLACLAGRMGDLPADVAAVLKSVLDDDDRDVRLAATRALGHTSHEAAPDLVGRLDDTDSYVRAEAARGLARAGAAGPEVFGLLADRDPEVRLAAAEAVALQPPAEALEPLVGLAFAFDGVHRREVARLLGTVDGDAAAARFLRTLGDEGEKRNWRVAIEVLEELYRPRGEPPVRMVA